MSATIASAMAAFFMAKRSAREGFEHRPQPLRLAAERTARTPDVVPRVHVEVRPRDAGGDEEVEEERGADRARASPPAAVVEIGGVPLVETPIASPHRP